MKSLKWAVVLMVGAAMGFAGGVFAAGAKKEALTPVSEIKWQPLDPKDTDMKGPSTATVFGDMKKKGPVGFLLRVPADGNPGWHTHSSDYYAVTVKGVEHDFTTPDEGPALPPGSYWYQPGKQVHSNHCEKGGGECIAFIYVPNGFDYQPAKAPAGGEKPAEKPADKPMEKPAK